MLDLTDRVALVTGASRGIGYQIALELAKAGAHVIAVARTVGGLEELDDAVKKTKGSATLVPLDLNDLDAIDKLGAAIFERWGRLDILIANAGILGTISPIGHIEPKVFDDVMKINVTANWRLIRSLEPLLLKSEHGKALIISSSAPHSCRPYWSAYAASKAAVEAMARIWAKEVGHANLKVNCVNPGGTRTHIRAQAFPGEAPDSLPTAQEVGAIIANLCDDQYTQTGMWYSVPDQKFMAYQSPQ